MRKRTALRLVLCAGTACMLAVVLAPWARAGGPLFIGENGNPVKWANVEVRGGPLNSQTIGINQAGVRQIFYRVDSGPLGTLTHDQAAGIVDRIFKSYTDIPTADIDFVNAGPILDPATGNSLDITAANVGKVISTANPSFQNPIVFDSDGGITGSGGVLGFFGFLQIDFDTDQLKEAVVVLNGRPLSRGLISEASFLGVFTHEFGHFAGPLDHAQINGSLASFDDPSIEPPGFVATDAYDVFAPFTETLYPFIFDAPPASQLASQFADSGFFVATIDLDTQNALSNLYPTADYSTSRGSIQGRVLVRAGGVDIPLPGINVICRRIDQGTYPPPASTKAFTNPPVIDSDGVPEAPNPQAVTDPLATVSSAVTGLEFGSGTYRVQGLPPGQYLVGIQQISQFAVGGSGIGPLGTQLELPFPEEYYNGTDSSSNTPAVFMPVTVTAGQVTDGIDIILNGISTVAPTAVNETEPNEKTTKGQKLTLPVALSGSAADGDAAKLKMRMPNGDTDPIEDLFRITVDQSRTLFILLDPTSGSGDLDLYLFDDGVSKKRSSLDDPHLLSFSAGPTAHEVIAFRVPPGTYIVGVSAFAGNLNYKLTILTSAP